MSVPLADGDTFAGYAILRLLGTGGMGEVYLAQHPRLPRREALKVLGAAVSDDDEYRLRFTREAEMVSTLRHPNIVTIYDRGDFEGRLWIAMEFVEGTDASRLLTERHPGGIPPELVVRIVTAIAAALDYAHSRRLLHRDIKPANILLGPRDHGGDRIMLADFGVARWLGQTSDLTGSDMTVGTVTYAAPEQLRGDRIDGRADQYALAATAYHLLTGSAPFTGSNPAIVISGHLGSQPPAIGSGRPELDRFGPVFARSLAKNPDQRYPQCRDFAAAMQAALTSAPGSAARHRKADPGPVRRRWLIGSLTAALVAGAAAALVLLLPGRGQQDSRPSTPPPPPPAVSGRMDLPVVVMGADCAVLGAAAVDANGNDAYCAREDPPGEGTAWSPTPERLRTRDAPPP